MSEIQNLVAAVDFKPESRNALALAEYLAIAFSAKIHLVYGARTAKLAVPYDLSALSGTHSAGGDPEEAIAKLEAELASKGIDVTAKIVELDPVRAILSCAESDHADAIVMGTRGYTGLKHAVLGSVAEGVLRKSRCPVLTEKRDEKDAASPIRRVVVGTDLSANSEAAVAWAFQFASKLDATIDLVHVLAFKADAFPHTDAWKQEIEEKTQEAAERVRAQSDQHPYPENRVAIHVLSGDAPARLITKFAQDQSADLVALGTHGYTGLRHAILGSVAEEALHRAACAVMTVKATS